MSSSGSVPLDTQIAVLREAADEAASYAKACAGSIWPEPQARARAEALQAAVRTLEGVVVLQRHPLFAVDLSSGAVRHLLPQGEKEEAVPV